MHPAQRRGSWKKHWCGGRPPRPGPPETLGNSLCPSELLLFTGTVRLEVVFFTRAAGRAMLLLAAASLVAFVLLLYMVSPLISPKPLALPGAHVVVSGP